MNVLVKEITSNQKKLFNQVIFHPVQTWEWGEFRKEMGNKVIRLGTFRKNILVEGFTITLHKIPKTGLSVGMLTQCPLPSVKVLAKLKEIGSREKVIFIRIEPRISASNGKVKRFINNQYIFRGRPFFNKSTYWIDLTKTEDELLKLMHPKTRYNIRLAERRGVRVTEDNSKVAFDKYLDLMDETTKRQKYFSHSVNYHKLMWKHLKKDGVARLLVAELNSETLVAWIIFFWKDFIYYPYGASSAKYREAMAPTKIMWEVMKLGKKLGAKRFDLWGADSGTGYARFKQSFGPELVEMIGTFDFVINRPLYSAYVIMEKLRWIYLKTKSVLFPSISSFK